MDESLLLGMVKERANFYQLDDPWDLPPYFLVRKNEWKKSNRTYSGSWKEKKEEPIAIRSAEDSSSSSSAAVPSYVGVRKTLEFYLNDGTNGGEGTKTDWIVYEYHHLRKDDAGNALFLQGCTVIRKVFRYDKDAFASAFTDLKRLLNADDGDEEYFYGDGVNTDITTPSDCMDSPCSVFPLGEGVSSDTTTPSCDSMDTPIDRKRKRTGAASGHESKVWLDFTKIYNTDYGMVYVVCHTCDRGYTSGHSKNGTNHLRRHTKSCASKHPNTGKAKDATTEWETEIWPWFLLLKTSGEHQPSGAMC